MKVDLKKIGLFLGLTFFTNWLMAILFFTFGGIRESLSFLIIALFYMLVPMFVTIIVQKFIYKEKIKKPFRVSFKFNRWFLVAWLLPPAIAFASIGVSLLLPNIQYSGDSEVIVERISGLLTPEQLQKVKSDLVNSPIHPIWITLLQGLVAGITVNALAGFGEELGWRGFMQKELESLGFWKSSLIIGIIWGIWHAPIILKGHNYPEHPVIGVLMMIVFCILLSPIFSFICIKANSTIAAAIAHGSLNATSACSYMFLQGGNDLTTGVAGLAGFIVLVFVIAVLAIFDRYFSKDPIIN